MNECERCVNKGLFYCQCFLPVRIYGCKRDTADADKKENKPAGQKEKEEETKMNTNMNELNLTEMEQVNGGSIIAAIGLGTACVCLVVEGIKFGKKIYNDLKDK